MKGKFSLLLINETPHCECAWGSGGAAPYNLDLGIGEYSASWPGDLCYRIVLLQCCIIWFCSQAGSHCMMIYVWKGRDINCLYFIWVCYYVWFYRGGQILNDAGLTAGSLQNDIEDLEAKENMLDKLITSAGRVEYHVILQSWNVVICSC